MWVLRRTDGAFVARASASSYTEDVLHARRYPTREAAEADRCPENEVAVDLHRLLDTS